MYTEEQKRYILKDNGIDPDKYELDDSGNVSPIVQAAPLSRVNPQQETSLPTPAGPSIASTVARGATQSIIPTITGLGAAGLAGLAFPEVGVPAFLASLASGYLGSKGGAAAQEAAIPDDIKKEIFLRPEDVATNPKTAAVSSFLPSLAAFNPVVGVRNLAGGIKAIPNMIRNPLYAGKALTTEQAAALANSGIGAGVGAGLEAYDKYRAGEEITPGDLALAAAGGAVLNSPYNNRFNKALGLHANPKVAPITPDIQEVPDTWSIYNWKGPKSVISPKDIQRLIDSGLNIGSINKSYKPLSAHEARLLKSDVNSVYNLPSGQVDPSIVQSIIDNSLSIGKGSKPYKPIGRTEAGIQGGEIQPAPYNGSEPDISTSVGLVNSPGARERLSLILKQQAEFSKAREAFAKSPNLKQIEATPTEEAQMYDAATKSEEVKPFEVPNNPANLPPEQPKEALGLVEQPGVGDKLALLSAKTDAIAQKQKEIDAWLKETKGRPNDNLGGGERRSLGEGLPDVNLYKEGEGTTNTPLTPQAEAIARRRGVAIANEETLPENIQGLSNPEKRQVRLNPKNSDTSTLGHEAIGHQFVEDLRRSSDPKDVKLVQDAESLAKRMGAKTPKEVDEFIANSIGEDFARRMKLSMSGSTKDRFNNWLNDLKNSWDYYRGNDSSDPNKLISLRGKTDAPYGTRTELLNEYRTTNSATSSGNSTDSSEDSLRRVQSGTSSSGRELPKEESRINAERTESRGGFESINDRSKTRIPHEGGDAARSGIEKPSEGIGRTNEGESSGSGEHSSRAAKSNSTTSESRINSSEENRSGDAAPGTNETSRATKGGGSSESSSTDNLENKFATGDVGKQMREERPKDSPSTGVPILRSQIDSVRADKAGLGDKAEPVAKALSNFRELINRYRGEYKENLLYKLRSRLGIGFNVKRPQDWITGDSPDAAKVREYMDAKQDGRELPALTANQKDAVSLIQETMSKTRSDQNSRPGLRKGEFDPDYFPQGLSREVINTIKNKKATPEAEAIRKKQVDYVADRIMKKKGVGREEALKQSNNFYDELLAGLSKDNVNTAASFGPIDKAIGYGVHPDLRETNLVRRLSNYLDRVSQRLAHYDAFTAHDDINNMIFGKGGEIVNDKVRHVYNRLSGIRPLTEQNFEAITGIIKAGVTGTYTGIKDVLSVPMLGAQHQDFFQTISTSLKGLADIRKNWETTFNEGLNRVHIGTLEGGDAQGGITGFLNIAKRARDIINEASLRNSLEQLSRTWAFSNGRILAAENLNNALLGKASTQGRKFLDDFAPEGWENNPKKLLNDNTTLNKIATRYAESIVGTYDAAGLPSWALEGPLSPVLSLNRWNIEKTNNWIKYTLSPIKQGNFKPLLNQTAFLMLGGLGIEKLNEYMSGRKSKLPSFEELKAAEDLNGNAKEGLVYKMIGLSALSGYAGELGSIGKMMMDMHYKNSDRFYNLMALEFAHKSYSYGTQFVEHFVSGDIDTAMDIANDYLSDYLQTWRLALSHLSTRKINDINRGNENRDMKVFKQLMGYDLGQMPSDTVKDYSNAHEQKFHQSRDLNEAAKEAPKAIKEVMDRSNGDYEQLKSGMAGLRSGGSYRGYPDLKNSPIQAGKYGEFLGRSQGRVEAGNRLSESLKMKALNRAKSKMVPKL